MTSPLLQPPPLNVDPQFDRLPDPLTTRQPFQFRQLIQPITGLLRQAERYLLCRSLPARTTPTRSLRDLEQIGGERDAVCLASHAMTIPLGLSDSGKHRHGEGP